MYGKSRYCMFCFWCIPLCVCVWLSHWYHNITPHIQYDIFMLQYAIMCQPQPYVTWWITVYTSNCFRKGRTQHIDDSVQDCSISNAFAMEILRSCTKPSTCRCVDKLDEQSDFTNMVSHISKMFCVVNAHKPTDRSSIGHYQNFQKDNDFSKLTCIHQHNLIDVCDRTPSPIAKTLRSTSIRHRSDTFASDRCLFDINPNVFAHWATGWL